MSDEFAKARFQEAQETGYGQKVCVPASLQFVLPDSLVIPQSVYEQADREDGLYPDDVLSMLKEREWITYQGYSIPSIEMRDYFADHVKYLIIEGIVLGIGLSIDTGEERHLIAVRGPLLADNRTIKAFDTSSKNPIMWRNLDTLLSRAERGSNCGRTNVWCIYPGKLSSPASLSR